MRVSAELRYELKYLIRSEQAEALTEELSARMSLDRNSEDDGRYPITSLYFDTPDYKAYWDKLDGHRNRRKVRVRVYGDDVVTPETLCFLEVKQRVNSMMRKRRVAMRYDEAIAFDDFDERARQFPAADAALLQEVYYLYRALQLRPACVVRYRRMAFEGDAYYPDLRVTLDMHLHGRTHDLSLTGSGFTQDRRILPAESAVLEVKSNSNIPLWLSQLLARNNCTFYRISKYCATLERCKAVESRQHVLVAPLHSQHGAYRDTQHFIED